MDTYTETELSKELSRGTLKVSLLHVMRSNAGFYIGRYCIETAKDSPDYCGGVKEPYSRESDYFATYFVASTTLTKCFEVRDCFENNHGYATGELSLTAK